MRCESEFGRPIATSRDPGWMQMDRVKAEWVSDGGEKRAIENEACPAGLYPSELANDRGTVSSDASMY